MCLKNGISNYIFWDSKKPFDYESKSQEVNLIDGISKLQKVKLDRLVSFDKTVMAKAEELQKQRTIVKVRNVTKKFLVSEGFKHTRSMISSFLDYIINFPKPPLIYLLNLFYTILFQKCLHFFIYTIYIKIIIIL